MKKRHAELWANALYFGNHQKMRNRMSNFKLACPRNLGVASPRKMSNLCVLNEMLQPKQYRYSRLAHLPAFLPLDGYTKSACPTIFGLSFQEINDGDSKNQDLLDLGIPPEGLDHKATAILIDLAIISNNGHRKW